MHYIKEIIEIEGYSLPLLFDTGEKKKIDLLEPIQKWSVNPTSSFRFLLDPMNFAAVQLNDDFGALYWENGLDLCPDVLYELSIADEADQPNTNPSKKDPPPKRYSENRTATGVIREKGSDE